jgi:flagellar basal-body rod modification protein FlgD
MTTIANTPPTQPGSSTVRSASEAAMLGKDEFLKLLVSQLRNQDPMSPMADKDFMGQMAQFTSVEQLSNMAKSIERMSTASQAAQSVALIGRTVTWKKADDSTGEGVAQSVSFSADGAIRIAVGDEEIAPNEIETVR